LNILKGEYGSMRLYRRDFLSLAASMTAAGFVSKSLYGFVPEHNWEKYDFGGGPKVKDRLNQGPFPTYPPEQVVPGSDVVMATTPSQRVLNNFGMGLVTYVCDEAGPPKKTGVSVEELIDELAALDLTHKLYIRLDWKDIQSKPGNLNFCPHWDAAFKSAKKYNKKIGFRIQLMNPEIPGHAIPDFVAEKIDFVKLGKTDKIGYPNKIHYAPRYDNPYFLDAFKDLDKMLADLYNDSSLVEYVDTCMYGFWGEGHTWPFQGNPFPDYITAEKTFVTMFEHQAQNWTKTPLVTNTQPDYSQVGNSEILDRTIRSNNWIRTDTIYIENTQIEALSNRPAWVSAVIENGISDGTKESLNLINGVSGTDRIISHVMDLGANYYSIWNWHRIRADRILNYYKQFPDMINLLARKIGYRVRPSWIWKFEKDGHQGLVFGMVNDGIAPVPGILRLTVYDDNKNILASGCLDAGYPKPQGVRQAQVILPKGIDWKGLKVKAEIEVKDKLYPVEWSCRENINEDGSLTLSPLI